MRRRLKEGSQDDWPPEHLRHFRAIDWPSKQPPEARPLAVDCAVCAFWSALGQWGEEWREANPDNDLDPVACCPNWPDCGFTYPDDPWHPELI